VFGFRDRLFIAIFTPLQQTTRLLKIEPGYDVPVFGFALEDLAMVLDGASWWVHDVVSSDTAYGQETHIRALK
jgi:hypothetical protein